MRERTCRNCSQPLTEGPYCPHCGQKDEGLPTLRQLFGQVLDDVFSLDSKVVRTYRTLLFRPGRITSEYLAGRRARYVRPLRLYLLNSLAYFLAAAAVGQTFMSTGDDGSGAVVRVGAGDGAATVEEVTDALRDADFDPAVRTRLRESLADARADSAWIDALAPRDTVEVDAEDFGSLPLIGSRVRAQIDKAEAMESDEVSLALNDAMMRHLPKVVFALVPVFAAILAMLYRRQRRRYAEHFVAALHGHAVAFLLLLVATVAPTEVDNAFVLAALVVHGLVGLRRVYGQGWVKTMVKAGLIAMTYSVVLLGGVAVAAVVAFLTI
jgi:hypothetical protein